MSSKPSSSVICNVKDCLEKEDNCDHVELKVLVPSIKQETADNMAHSIETLKLEEDFKFVQTELRLKQHKMLRKDEKNEFLNDCDAITRIEWITKYEEVDLKEEDFEMEEHSLLSSGIIEKRYRESTGNLYDQRLIETRQGMCSSENLPQTAVKEKYIVQSHFLVPENTEDVNLFHYDRSDKTKKHSLKHESSENRFQCDHCDYKTNQKCNFSIHLLIHKNAEDLNWFRCDQCDYKTLRKGDLNTHSLKHQSSENWFQCDQCDYKTVQKCNLNSHALKHKNPEELNWFRCGQCDYKSLRQWDIKIHSLKHENSENWLQCDHCNYKTIYKQNLKSHSLKHQTPDEHNCLRCNQCGFQTLRKWYLKTHLLNHKNCEKGNWFQCACCDYKTMRKADLKTHMRIHKNPEELPWFRCDQCGFQTIYKRNMKAHLIKHKN